MCFPNRQQSCLLDQNFEQWVDFTTEDLEPDLGSESKPWQPFQTRLSHLRKAIKEPKYSEKKN